MKIKSASSAAKSVFIGGIASKAIAFVGSIALARLLVPEDYGYWVIVTMITSFFSLVVDVGFEYYYIVNVNVNKGEETSEAVVKEIENSIFFLRLIVNSLLFSLQFGLSYLPISLLSSPIDQIIRALSFVHIINVMGRINEVRLKKAFNFEKITVFNVISEIISTIVKVVCALIGIGVMSFAWGSITKVLFNNIGLVSVGRFVPSFSLVEKKRIVSAMTFASYMWLTQLGQYLSMQLDKFLLKSNYSLSQIGFYSFSNGISYLFIQYVLSPQGTLIMNYISNNQKNTPKIEDFISMIFNIVLIVIVPVQLLLYLHANDFISIVYGEKWIGSLSLFRIFVFYTLLEIIFMPFANILTAFGKVKIRAVITYVNVLILFVVLYFITTLSVSINIYAIGFICCKLLNSLIKTVISIKIAKVSIARIYTVAHKSFSTTFISSVSIILISCIFEQSNFYDLVVVLFASITLHFGLHWLFNREAMLIIKQKMILK